MLSILGRLIVSKYVPESITDVGRFGHVGLCQLRTKLRKHKNKQNMFCTQLTKAYVLLILLRICSRSVRPIQLVSVVSIPKERNHSDINSACV